jgi:sugar/nucleoside kinase (ribokinase family)
LEAFSARGVSAEGFVIAKGHMTNAYCKPMRKGYLGIEIEDPRLDFESFSPVPKEFEDALIEKLRAYAATADVLCVSDQFENGCITERVRSVINELAASGLLTVVDSRNRIDRFSNCILKPNEIECAAATEMNLAVCASEDDFRVASERLAEKTTADVCMTLGARGCLINRKGAFARVNALPVMPPVDTVGAGDCFLSSFALAVAAGASDLEAGVIASIASAICVKKLNTTGSADRSEILELFYLYGEDVDD